MKIILFSFIIFISFNCKKDSHEQIIFNPSNEPILVATTGPGLDRVDALSFIRLNDNTIFGSFSYWTSGRGADYGNSHQQIVTSINGGESYTWKNRLPYISLGDLHASHYQKKDGSLIMLHLSQSNFGLQEWSLVKQESKDGGSTYNSPVYLGGNIGNGERWIAAAGRIFKLADGTLLYPVARRGLIDRKKRDGFLFISKDDGDTWSEVERSANTPLIISNTGGSADYATEPGLYEASNKDLYYYYRSKEGYVRGAKLIRNGNYFSTDTLVNILPAPASTSEIKYIPGLKKYMAVHNDVADVVNGNMGTGRNNLVYSLSNSGQPGTFKQMPNKIKQWQNDQNVVFEPSIFSDLELRGAIISYTVYSSNGFKQYVQFLSYDMISNQNEW